jgi:hypothetical protein
MSSTCNANVTFNVDSGVEKFLPKYLKILKYGYSAVKRK